jgi:hypothetical protein
MSARSTVGIFRCATFIENIAAVTAAGAVGYMLSLPFTISRSEAIVLDRIALISKGGLLTAWLCGFISIVFMLIAGGQAAPEAARSMKRWGYISVALTLISTIMVVATARVGAVAGPP